MALVPSPLVNGPLTTKLDPTSYSTTGSGSALIAQPKRTYRTVRVEVNSIDRNYGKDPFSSEFRWTFPFPVKEVKEVRVISGTLPVPYLNIDKGWNQFTFQEGIIEYTVSLPIGYYIIDLFVSMLTGVLNGLGCANTYCVDQVANTGQIRIRAITGDAFFGILFATGNFVDTLDAKTKAILELHSPARIMGFGWADYCTQNGVIIAPRVPNLWYSLEKGYLYLNFDSTQDLRAIFRGAGRKEPSAIVYFDELNTYNYSYPNNTSCNRVIPLTKFLNKETYDTVILPSPASISRISYLEVSYRDMFYNLINTQGRELSLLLELVICD